MEVPLFKPSVTPREAELVNQVLSCEGDYYMADRLEQNVVKYLNCTHALSTTNSTSSLHLALRAMELKRGDKVVCSVNSFPDVAEVIRHFDAEPIFVDIDKDDFNIDIKEFEKTLHMHEHKKLRAAFIGHVGGQSSDLDPIYEIAKRYKVKIIDDATQALGAHYKGKKLGSTGSYMSCFRFGTQIRYSLATAGILTTQDEEIFQRAKLLRNHAIQSDEWDTHGNIGYIYDVVDIGLKYDINELCAAYNIGQLERINVNIKRRQDIARVYDEELKDCPHVSTPVKVRDHTYTKYIIKIDKNRDLFARELKARGISTGLHFVPLHLLKYYKEKYSLKINDFPTALSNYQHILSIPIDTSLSDDMVGYVCRCIKQIAKHHV